MSEENVETLQRAFEASGTEDYDLSPFFALYRPDVELYVSPTAVEAGTWRGAEAVKQYWRELLAMWDHRRQEPKEFIDLGDRVLVVVDVEVGNRMSDVPLRQEVAVVYSFAGGQISRLEYYFSGKEEALEAAGLSE